MSNSSQSFEAVDLLRLLKTTNGIYGAIYEENTRKHHGKLAMIADATDFPSNHPQGKVPKYLAKRACAQAVRRNEDLFIGIGERGKFPAWVAVVLFEGQQGDARIFVVISSVRNVGEATTIKERMVIWRRKGRR